MTETSSVGINKALLILSGVLLVILGAVGGWLWQSHHGASVSSGDRVAIETVVHDYILKHPDILPEAMGELRKQENAKQLAVVKGDVDKPFPGAVLGNPNGKVTLIEFTDYACGYCRQSVPEVEAVIAAHPDLRVVVRELPILSPASADAAKMALAAAQQGRYAQFHNAMFAAGKPDPATIDAAATAAGVDLAKARQAIADPRMEAELANNITIARQLGFNGTPSWVIGDQVLSGAVGREQLAKAVEEAKS
jgi:protein-disulfide isomerase